MQLPSKPEFEKPSHVAPYIGFHSPVSLHLYRDPSALKPIAVTLYHPGAGIPGIPLRPTSRSSELVAVSGAIEIILGLLLIIPNSSRLAAWGVIALLIAVFPSNIHVFQHQEIVPASPLAHLTRLL